MKHLRVTALGAQLLLLLRAPLLNQDTAVLCLELLLSLALLLHQLRRSRQDMSDFGRWAYCPAAASTGSACLPAQARMGRAVV